MSVAGRPAVDTTVFRDAASRFASGVTVAAGAHDGLHHAITATAFASLSIDPPMVLLALDRAGQLIGLVRDSGRVGLSVLSESQEEIGRRTSAGGRRLQENVDEAETTTAVTGAPVLVGALAWFDCEVESISEHGDHAIIVGRVVAAASMDGEPLVYFGRRYRKLGPQLGEPGVSR
ncbi:MAG TPA: flavin reductase family protein [Candidatus Dormibacteraeota bacterium]